MNSGVFLSDGKILTRARKNVPNHTESVTFADGISP